MKKTASHHSGIFVLRSVLAVVCLALSAFLAFMAFAASPDSGTITPSTATNVTWTGTGTGVPPAAGGEADCEEGANCDTFKLTISGTPADWVGKQVKVQITWLANSTDYDFYIHKGSVDGPVVGVEPAVAQTPSEQRLALIRLETLLRDRLAGTKPHERSAEQQAVALVASSVLFHARQDKPVWQAHFERLRVGSSNPDLEEWLDAASP